MTCGYFFRHIPTLLFAVYCTDNNHDWQQRHCISACRGFRRTFIIATVCRGRCLTPRRNRSARNRARVTKTKHHNTDLMIITGRSLYQKTSTFQAQQLECLAALCEWLELDKRIRCKGAVGATFTTKLHAGEIMG